MGLWGGLPSGAFFPEASSRLSPSSSSSSPPPPRGAWNWVWGGFSSQSRLLRLLRRQARARLHSERAFSEAAALLCAGLLACWPAVGLGRGQRRASRKEPHREGPGGPGRLQVAPWGPRPGEGSPGTGRQGEGQENQAGALGTRQLPEATQPHAEALRPQRGLSPPYGLLQHSGGSRRSRDTGDLGESSFRVAGPGVLAVPDPQAVLHFLLCPPVDGGSPSVPPPPSPAAVQAWKGGEGTPSGQRPKRGEVASFALTHCAPPHSPFRGCRAPAAVGPGLGCTPRWGQPHRRLRGCVPPSPRPEAPDVGLALDGGLS